jgi:hypothetical protein
MACYHFPTQLAGTDRLIRRRGCERVLGPKTLTKWHAIERAGMARPYGQFMLGLEPKGQY